MFYILGPGHIIVPEPDMLTWARWHATADRRVALDEVAPGIEVSTVFLGIDHGSGNGSPILFETMVFGDYGGGDTQRYATWDEAAAGHCAKVVELLARIGSAKASRWTNPA